MEDSITLMEVKPDITIMKLYDIYIFTQSNCEPCYRLKDYVKRLPEEQQKEIHLVPFKDTNKPDLDQPTSLAKSLGVVQTPTLCVTHRDLTCEYYEDDEYCELNDEIVETVVGATAIITALPSIIAAYTYAIDE